MSDLRTSQSEEISERAEQEQVSALRALSRKINSDGGRVTLLRRIRLRMQGHPIRVHQRPELTVQGSGWSVTVTATEHRSGPRFTVRTAAGDRPMNETGQPALLDALRKAAS